MEILRGSTVKSVGQSEHWHTSLPASLRKPAGKRIGTRQPLLSGSNACGPPAGSEARVLHMQRAHTHHDDGERSTEFRLETELSRNTGLSLSTQPYILKIARGKIPVSKTFLKWKTMPAAVKKTNSSREKGKHNPLI